MFLPVATGISGLHLSFIEELGLVSSGSKELRSSLVAMGISWSPLSGLKDIKPPVVF